MDIKDAAPTTMTVSNAEELEGRLKGDSLARRLVSAYRAHADGAARRQAIRLVVEQRLSDLRGK
jgi:hypothetical protein